MKKIFFSSAASICMLLGVAQTKLDRSIRPKPGPAPIITIKDPVVFMLTNGMTVLVVENHRLPKITATLNIDAGPIIEGSKAGVLSLMGEMLEEGTTTIPKEKFDASIDQMGADVHLNPAGGSVGALTRYFDKSLTLFADALQHPAFPQASFDKLKTMTLTNLKQGEKDAKNISARVINALSYGANTAMGEYQTEETTKSITLDDVKDAYKKYITPSRSYLTIVGDITPAAAKTLATKLFGNWKGTTLKLPVVPEVTNVPKTEINIIDVPYAVQSEITVTNLVDLPLNSPDIYAVKLANVILGGTANARLFMNLREKHGFTYGSYSSIGSGRFQSMFKATASVRNEKTDSAVTEILNELQKIRTEKVSDEELASAKSLYNGSYAFDMENPSSAGTDARNILINNLPKDYYRTYLQKINAVTPEDIQRVANKYFNQANTRVIAVGKSEQIKPGLAKLGFPIKEYDRYAKPVTESAMMSTPTATLKPAEIIANYIKAIGGADELNKVTSINTAGEMSMQGMTMQVSRKEMMPNMESMDVKMGTQSVMHRTFNGTTGYQMQMGNKKEMDADEIGDSKDQKSIFPQLFYNSGYTLENAGTEKVYGKNAYKIKVTSPSGKSHTESYDVASGFLVKSEMSTKMAGQDATQTLQYGNYKKVGNIMVPFSTTITAQTPMGQQEFTIDTKEIKLNEGVTADDFK